ncbi:hypothetical protein [Scytonema sp. PRP1]|uniref:hypothetical protein n=1 Tax=Scytonema sp. PRP1 TaxID=3120513 RepID=UPI002FD24E48
MQTKCALAYKYSIPKPFSDPSIHRATLVAFHRVRAVRSGDGVPAFPAECYAYLTLQRAYRLGAACLQDLGRSHMPKNISLQT